MNRQLRSLVESLVAHGVLNRLPPDYGGAPIFARPLVGIARGDDPVFQRFKEVTGPKHLTPVELWI